MSFSHRQQVLALLEELQLELVALHLWSESPPPDAAFLSQTPFCLDTMSFDKWLQFVLIPKLRALIIEDKPLPAKIAVTPMAEEVFKERLEDVQALLHVLTQLDAAMNGKNPSRSV